MAQPYEQKTANSGQKQEGPAQGALEQARQTAGELVDKARAQVEQGAGALGSGMRNLAGTVRQNAPHEGAMGTAAATLADTLERGGHYLEEEGMSGLVTDMGTLIRRNPVPAVLVGVGLGFLFGQMCRSER